MKPEKMILINGHEFTFFPGETILQVTQRNGIDIPTLCFMKRAAPTGACRMCLVEVDGARGLVASCAMPAAPRMVVRTETPRVTSARRLNIELLLASGTHDCLVCEANGQCKLQALAYEYGVETSRFARSPQVYPTEDENPFILRDFSRCVLCGRCVQACNEVVVNRAISYGYRGPKGKIVAAGDRACMRASASSAASASKHVLLAHSRRRKPKERGAPGSSRKSGPLAPTAAWAASSIFT